MLLRAMGLELSYCQYQDLEGLLGGSAGLHKYTCNPLKPHRTQLFQLLNYLLSLPDPASN